MTHFKTEIRLQNDGTVLDLLDGYFYIQKGCVININNSSNKNYANISLYKVINTLVVINRFDGNKLIVIVDEGI